MQTATSAQESQRNDAEAGVIYRTACQNPGCGHTFNLRITPQNASLLSGTMACPRCRRAGGMLKPQGRIAHKLFSAKLVFRMTGIAPRLDDDEFSDAAELRY